MSIPPPTRAAALDRLAAFTPGMGRAYAAGRNHDHGPANRGNVSGLSPHVRHRLVTEAELVAAALARHAPSACEKFVQEVFWRSYWKGWLEQRPSVWLRHQADLARAVDGLATQGGLRRAYEDAVSGRTGIACFDAWANELVETGYLHNHARMWFASIWIFTLRLPWVLGADFTFRHFMDGDPASNTLSWRWVAGLHTRGKHYLARASNIAEYTGGRFDPRGELDERAAPLEEEPAPEPARPLAPADRAPEGPVALLLTEEDCLAETWALGRSRVVALGAFAAPACRSPLGSGAAAEGFVNGALSDGRARAGARCSAPPVALADASALAAWAKGAGGADGRQARGARPRPGGRGGEARPPSPRVGRGGLAARHARVLPGQGAHPCHPPRRRAGGGDVSGLVIEGLTCRYGGTAAVDALDLAVPDGALLCLLVPAGCGKTTTLRAVAGLVAPDAGRILRRGEVLSAPGAVMPPERRRMAMIFQSYALWPHMTVAANVAYALKLRGLARAEMDARVAAVLRAVRREAMAERLPADLSCGQQQRVAIARSLAMEPRSLLMDEPLSNLDAALREEMRFELRRLHEAHGVTTLYVTHDQSEAMATADLVAVMDRGRIAQVGPPEALYGAPADAFVARFLGGTNIIPGRHLGGNVVDCGAFRLACAGGTAGAGGAALVAIRPHAVVLAAAPGENVIAARLLRATFLGPVRDLAVEAEGGTALRLTVPADQPLPQQGAVLISLPPRSCRMLPDAPATQR